MPLTNTADIEPLNQAHNFESYSLMFTILLINPNALVRIYFFGFADGKSFQKKSIPIAFFEKISYIYYRIRARLSFVRNRGNFRKKHAKVPKYTERNQKFSKKHLTNVK